MLTDEKGDLLQKHIDVYRDIEKTVKDTGVTSGVRVRIRKKAEAEARLIKRNFSYTKVEADIRGKFRAIPVEQGSDEN